MFKYFPYTKKYYLTHPWEWVRSFLHSLKYSRQRARKGYSDYDVWDIDYWFLSTAPKMLHELADKTYSIPLNLSEEEWKMTLNTMAEHFERALSYIERFDKEEDMRIEFEAGMKLFTKYFFDLWM